MAEYKQIIRDALVRMSEGDPNAFDSIVSADYVCHEPLAGDVDLNGWKQQMADWGKAFPEGDMTLLGVYGDGDYVCAHWSARFKHLGEFMGVEPTGNYCTLNGLSLYRFENGKLVEEWDQYDSLGLLRQIGVIEVELPSYGRAASEPVQPQA